MNVNGGWSIAWFVVLYFISAYFRLYYTPDYKIKNKLLGIIILSFILPGSKVLIDILSNKINFLNGKSTILFCYESFFVILLSLSVFVLFLNIKIKQGLFANIVLNLSKHTFAVYLIHHHAKVYPIMWGLINGTRFLDKWYFPAYMTLVVLCIYMSCTIIDYLRNLVFKPLNKSSYIENLSDKIFGIANNIIKRV